jgi:hypothetical protein
MKIGLFLVALATASGMATGSGDAQERHPTTAKTVGKPAPVSSLARPSSQHGSIGGPVSKVNGINGMVGKPKH